MLIFYSFNSCLSSRKTRKWLIENDIEFNEINISKGGTINKKELINIVSLLEGFDELISTRSKTFRRFSRHINDMTFTQAINLIHRHPDLLKRPIIFDGKKKVQIGFSESGLTQFKPRERKKEIFDETLSIIEKEYLNQENYIY